MATVVLSPMSLHSQSDHPYNYGNGIKLRDLSDESVDSGYTEGRAASTQAGQHIVIQPNGKLEDPGVNKVDNQTQNVRKREIEPKSANIRMEWEDVTKHDPNEISPLRGCDNTSIDSGVGEEKETTKPSGTDVDNHTPLITQNVDADRSPNDDAENRINPKVHVESPVKSFWLKIVVIFSILDVLLLITIFVVAYGIPCLDSPGAVQAAPRRCLKCMDVYLTKDDKQDNIYNFNIDADDNCCSDNETLLIQKYVIKRYRSDQAKASAERGFPERTAIHLDLDLQDKNSIQEGSNQELKWTTPSLMFGDLSVSEDRTRIEIGRTGLYYISPKVVFDDNKGDIGADGLDPMSLQLYRVRQSDHQLLLETKETHCAHSDTKCAKPSSGQGVFKMEKGDTVVVKVTKPCGLVLNDTLNHFDMYMI